jgi:hypothetical protein
MSCARRSNESRQRRDANTIGRRRRTRRREDMQNSEKTEMGETYKKRRMDSPTEDVFGFRKRCYI